jgi:exonuclease 3'-5' domain-containing protein 1
MKLLVNEKIIKIFHDCSEDCSLLSNLLRVEIKNVFDTQIAHRICYESIFGSSLRTKHSNISLADLIKEYLNVENRIKCEICEIMNKNVYFWKAVKSTNKASSR